MPGCWSRVQRYLLFQTIVQRHLVAAEYSLSDGVVVAPQNGHKSVNGSPTQLQPGRSHCLHTISKNDSSGIGNAEAGSKWGPSRDALGQTSSIGAFSSSGNSVKVPLVSLVGNAVPWVNRVGPKAGGRLSENELAPFPQSHARDRQRGIYTSSLMADAENLDDQSGILNIVNDMIKYCNTCRSKGNQLLHQPAFE